MIIVGCDGRILHINPEARALLKEPDAQAGDPFYSLFDDTGSADCVIDVVWQALRDRKNVHSSDVTLRRDNELARLDLKVSKFRNADGTLRGVVIVINDVTHQHMCTTFASIFASGVAVVFFYVSVLGFFSELMRTTETRTLMNSLLMLLPAAGSIYIAVRCSLPLEMLGLSLKNWRADARDAIALSLLVCACSRPRGRSFRSSRSTRTTGHRCRSSSACCSMSRSLRCRSSSPAARCRRRWNRRSPAGCGICTPMSSPI